MLIDLSEKVDLTLQQGATTELRLTWADENRNPIDLTGYSVELNISAAHRRPPAWSWRNQVNRARVINAENGEIQIAILPDTTLEFGQLEQLVYDVTLEASTGRRTTIMAGSIRIRQKAGAA